MTSQEKDTIEKLKDVVESKKEDTLHSFSFKPKEKTLVAWEAAEKEQYHRGPVWYIILIAVMLLAALYGLYTGSWTTIIVFLLIPVAVILYANTEPKKIEVFVTEKGIYIDKKFTSYEDISIFWIFEDFEVKKFGFRRTNWLQTEKEVLLHDLDTDILRRALNRYLKEDKDKKEGFISHFIRVLKL